MRHSQKPGLTSFERKATSVSKAHRSIGQANAGQLCEVSEENAIRQSQLPHITDSRLLTCIAASHHVELLLCLCVSHAS